MNNMNELTEHYKDKFPHLKSYTECVSRTFISGLAATFLSEYSGLVESRQPKLERSSEALHMLLFISTKCYIFYKCHFECFIAHGGFQLLILMVLSYIFHLLPRNIDTRHTEWLHDTDKWRLWSFLSSQCDGFPPVTHKCLSFLCASREPFVGNVKQVTD